jgi:thiamine biosynthesis lipoprotein
MTASCARVRRARPLLGTLVEIVLEGTDEYALHRVAGEAFGAVERVHRLMSFHDRDSDVTRLNRGAHHAPVQVDAATWDVLELAGRVARASAGVFDVTVGGRMMAQHALPKMTSVAPDPAACFRDIELLPGRRVAFRRELAIDLGGIAKGYAVDCAVEVLASHEGMAGWVNAGGDLRAFGGIDVPVQIRDPGRPALVGATAVLNDAALATSARYARSHGLSVSGLILHPHAAPSSRRPLSASVRASTCALADALAKVAYLMKDNAQSVLSGFGASGFLLGQGRLSLIGEQT